MQENTIIEPRAKEPASHTGSLSENDRMHRKKKKYLERHHPSSYTTAHQFVHEREGMIFSSHPSRLHGFISRSPIFSSMIEAGEKADVGET